MVQALITSPILNQYFKTNHAKWHLRAYLGRIRIENGEGKTKR